VTRLRVNVAVRSAAPVERVWAVLADARRWREWTPDVATRLARRAEQVP
jgi:hypothetical protein